MRRARASNLGASRQGVESAFLLVRVDDASGILVANQPVAAAAADAPRLLTSNRAAGGGGAPLAARDGGGAVAP